MACDRNSSRFTYANPVLGSVYQYNERGVLLWRSSLGSFVPLTEAPGEKPTAAAQILADFEDWASLVTWVDMNAKVAMVAHRTGQKGCYVSFLDSVGARVGAVGPWDAISWRRESDDWLFFVGGEKRYYDYVPKCVVRVKFSGSAPNGPEVKP
ncbi:MAG: hypothetical protein U0V87_12335 [Acidobacteriota bacterium]